VFEAKFQQKKRSVASLVKLKKEQDQSTMTSNLLTEFDSATFWIVNKLKSAVTDDLEGYEIETNLRTSIQV
jgi:hypothetical protein